MGAAATIPADGAGVARAVAASAAAQLGAKVAHLALNMVSSLVLIRALAPGAYGDYVLVITVTVLAGLVSNVGLDNLAVREIVRDETAEPGVLGAAIAARLGLAALSVALVQVLLLAMGASGRLHVAGAVASLLVVGEALLTIVVVFHVRLQQQYEALVRLAGEAAETALVIWLVAGGAPLAQLVAAPVAGAAVAVLLAAWLARRRFGARVRLEWWRMGPLLRGALVVGPALLAGVALLRLDSVLLGALRPPRELGIYAGAFQPIEYLLLASAVVINVLFPVLARLHAVDAGGFGAAYARTSELLLALVLPVPVVLSAVAGPLVESVYGAPFAASAAPLQVLACALVLLVAAAWHAFVLLASGHQRETLVYNVAALAFSAALSVVLITWLGYMGAAVAMLGTALFVVAWSTRAVVRTTGARVRPAGLGRVALANVLLAATVWALLGLGAPWWAAGGAAVVAYPAWLVLAGVVGAADVRALRRAPGAAGGDAT